MENADVHGADWALQEIGMEKGMAIWFIFKTEAAWLEPDFF